MKRNLSLAVLLFAWLAVLSGCAALGGSAACGRGAPSVEPERARPGEAFVFRGVGFGGGCDDSNLPFRPEPPQQDVRIEMQQGGRTWDLATVDADADHRIEATLGVPEDAEPGGTVVVTDAGPDDPFGPVEVPFEVLPGGGPETGGVPTGSGGSEANQDPMEMTQQGEGDEPVASGVLAACAGGGAPVDLVAEGKVRRLRVETDSSLVRIRLERVLAGDAAAGETVSVRTSSGTGVVTEDDVGFEEGARYLLRLQRQGDVFTTNICLGTERLE